MKKLISILALLTCNAFAMTYDDPTLKWNSCPAVFPRDCDMAVLKGDPTQPNTDIFIKVPAKYVLPSHKHTSPEHMILIKGEMTIEYRGKKPVVAKAGTYLYGPANEPHKAQCSDKGQCVLFVAFESPIDATRVKDF